ncbi:YeaC family protein [Enterobacteriaceae bacterium LUAb1]
MNIAQLIESMTPEIYQRLVTAVELGKWPDGVSLSAEQKAHALQIVMLWQAKYNENPQHMSIGRDGKVVTRSKQQLKEEWGISDAIITRFGL